MRKCLNRKCGEALNELSRYRFCPACRFLSRVAFAIGAGLVGAAWGVVQLLGSIW